MRFRPIAFALVLTALAGAVHAQDAALDRVQNLINTGRLTEARQTLAQWERTKSDPTSDASSADRARALYLAGVLSTEPQDAENAFLNVVLSYPSSSVAPDALLRLGQSLYTAGDARRAIEYLSRLQYDYPPSTARETGILWLARAQLAAGAAAEACGTTRDNLAATTNPNLRTLIEIERDRACAASGGTATRTAAAATPVSSLPDLGVAVDSNVRDAEPARPAGEPIGARPAPDARPTPRTDAPTLPAGPRAGDAPRNGGVDAAGSGAVDATRNGAVDAAGSGAVDATRNGAANSSLGEYAVQTAAFSQRQSAERIAAELKAKGFDARVVTVPGSPLFRVRFGAFATSREAAAVALHIRDAGFATLIVSDVRLEQRQ